MTKIIKKPIILNTICKDQNGEKTEKWDIYYQNGKLWQSWQYENGKWEGEFKEYDESGQLKIIGNYKKEVREGEGESKSYYYNSQLEKVLNYENGKETGEWKQYHTNGRLWNIGNYENGKKMENGNFIMRKEI